MKPSQILARAEERGRQLHNQQVDWYRFSAKKDDDAGPTKVYIYDAIGSWFGVSAQDFVRELNDLDVDHIELHINSPGGSAFDGIAIRNAIAQHDAKVTTIVDGLAASAASIIALAGDEVVMASGSQMMIHDASGLAWGPAAEMREVADVLDKLSNSLADLYAEKGGGEAKGWRKAMLAETWYTAQEAVDAGLADRVLKRDGSDPSTDGTDDDSGDPENAFDLSMFAYAGRSHAPAPIMPAARARTPGNRSHQPPAEPAESITPTEGDDTVSDTLTSGLRERLGIKPEAEIDEASLMAALDEALAEQSESTVTLPTGTVAISQAVLDDLTAKAARGDAARAEQLGAQRDQLLNEALAEGRIKASETDDWRAQLTAADGTTNPVAAKLLAGLAKGTVPMESSGYTGGVKESTDSDNDVRNTADYKNWEL